MRVDDHCRGVRVLGDVGETLGDDVVGGELDRLRPSEIAHAEPDGTLARVVSDSIRPPTMITDCGRIDPVSQSRNSDRLAATSVIASSSRYPGPGRCGRHHRAFRASVTIRRAAAAPRRADPAPEPGDPVVRRRRDAPATSELLEPRGQLNLQPGILDHQTRRDRD